MAGLEEYRLNSQSQYSSLSELDDNFRNDNYYTASYGRIGGPVFDNRPESLPLDDDSLETNDSIVRKYVGVGVNLASLIAEHLLSHPFVVLRRQCQVNVNSIRYHIFPVTLIPVVLKLQQRQGFSALWKGVGSVLLVRGVTMALEDVLSKFTPWPKELSWHGSMKSIGQHILLKCSCVIIVDVSEMAHIEPIFEIIIFSHILLLPCSTSLALVTPFFSASLVETVQSEIASEKPGVLDVFREGACRLLCWTPPATGRMLPVWALVVPTVSYGLFKYIIANSMRHLVSSLFHYHYKAQQEKKGALPRDNSGSVVSAEIELKASVFALSKIHLQGTRTITDNLDSGTEVLPIITNYRGASDCYDSTVSAEGSLGLFKGFGALVLQYSVHIAFLRLAKLVLTELSGFLYPANAPTQHSMPATQPTQVLHPQMQQKPMPRPYRPYDDVYFQGNIPPQV
ncbi:hypothetical protein J437_LFUL004907 [Ladona fulva]|uniref:Solute carrier family 25 member 46 n=1 Tax=Ladona fulva TaxID=123851 RepID=A0A8K0K6X9_LADFU|nr:hypothetical protein J437_LFUL004907 [Ladona fulva]